MTVLAAFQDNRHHHGLRVTLDCVHPLI